MAIETRYAQVAEEVAACCREAGRDPREVTLVAVSKTVDASAVAQAMAAGARDFGENRPDALLSKQPVHPDATWHFIGNIQSRRIPDIVAASDLIHSLYQLRHAEKIDAAAAAAGKVQDVLVEVNVSGEESKSGAAPAEALELVAACGDLANVRVRGFMTMAPRGDAEVARACFAGLARLLDEARRALPPEVGGMLHDLSMGMSEDWREAVREGATIVRIGRAIFDEAFGE